MFQIPRWCSGKESACQCRRLKRHEFDPWVWKILWRRTWQPTTVFLPGKFHGQRSLAGYSPWGHKELDTTEYTCTHSAHTKSTSAQTWNNTCTRLVIVALFLMVKILEMSQILSIVGIWISYGTQWNTMKL